MHNPARPLHSLFWATAFTSLLASPGLLAQQFNNTSAPSEIESIRMGVPLPSGKSLPALHRVPGLKFADKNIMNSANSRRVADIALMFFDPETMNIQNVDPRFRLSLHYSDRTIVVPDPRPLMISMQEAIVMARKKEIPEDLREEFYKLVQILAKMDEDPEGNRALNRAAARGIWIALDNQGVIHFGNEHRDVSNLTAYHEDRRAVIVLRLPRDKYSSPPRNGPYFDIRNNRSEDENLYEIMFHELDHDQQMQEIGNSVQSSVRIIDKIAQEIAEEARAEVIQTIAERKCERRGEGRRIQLNAKGIYEEFRQRIRNIIVNLYKREEFDLGTGDIYAGEKMEPGEFLVRFLHVEGLENNILEGRLSPEALEDADGLQSELFQGLGESILKVRAYRATRQALKEHDSKDRAKPQAFIAAQP